MSSQVYTRHTSFSLCCVCIVTDISDFLDENTLVIGCKHKSTYWSSICSSEDISELSLANNVIKPQKIRFNFNYTAYHIHTCRLIIKH